MERRNLKGTIDSLLTVLIFIYLVLGICVFGIATYYNYYKLLGLNLVAFVLLSTSIVAAAFLFIRIYIDNQLSIKEKEMLKEYSDKVEEVKKDITERLTSQLASQSEDINKKFGSQLEDMNKKLDSHAKVIDELIRSFNDFIKNKKENGN